MTALDFRVLGMVRKGSTVTADSLVKRAKGRLFYGTTKRTLQKLVRLGYLMRLGPKYSYRKTRPARYTLTIEGLAAQQGGPQ